MRDVLNEIRSEIKTEIEKKLQGVETFLNLKLKDFEKLDEIVNKISLSLTEKKSGLKGEDVILVVKNVVEEYIKEAEKVQNENYSKVIDFISKKVIEIIDSNIVNNNLSNVREEIIKEFSIVQNTMCDELKQNYSRLSSDFLLLSQKIDNCINFIATLSKKENNISIDILQELYSEIEKVYFASNNIRKETEILNSEESDPLFFKKYYNNILEIETKTSKIKEIFKFILSQIK